MSDHKAEAVNNLTPEYTDPRNPPNSSGQAALVHATLYLAEQQRIANLIALLGKEPEANLPPVNSGVSRPAVLRMIREGLAIS